MESKIAFGCTIVQERQFRNIWVLFSWLMVLFIVLLFSLVGGKTTIQRIG